MANTDKTNTDKTNTDKTNTARRNGRGKRSEADEAARRLAEEATLEELDYEFEPTESDGDMFGGTPAKKAEHFWPSFKRLLGLLRPEWLGMAWVTLLVVVSVALTVIAPKILGQATDVIFNGAIGGQLPKGITLDQAVQGARA